jgi:hypothetical protein
MALYAPLSSRYMLRLGALVVQTKVDRSATDRSRPFQQAVTMRMVNIP